jgi:hypothetical protein
MSLPIVQPKTFVRKIVHATLHAPVLNKALLLLSIILLGSSLCAYELSPDSPLSDRHNPLNVYLVKLSWGWTLICIIPTVLVTSFLYSGLNFRVILRHFGRLGVAHLIWMSITSLFVLIDSYTGVCNNDSDAILKRSVCIKQGHKWAGFDISGHVFLLTYCIYVITEECANIKLEVWGEYEGALQFENRVVDKLTDNMKQMLPQAHRLSSYIIDKLEILALTEILLWTVMVTATSLYFHSFAEKVLGYLFGVVSWYLTYRLLYGRSSYLPCNPDEGTLHPLRHLRSDGEGLQTRNGHRQSMH